MASELFSIFVRWTDGKTKTLAVLPEESIASVLLKLLDKVSMDRGLANLYWLQFEGKKLELTRTVSSYKIVKDSNLQANMRTLVPTPPSEEEQAVTAVLREELGQLLADLDENQFIFIGISSYVPDDHWSVESVLRQQCPRTVTLQCWKERWDLTVLLIDPGFNPASDPQETQLWSLDNWQNAPVASRCGDKVRMYRHTTATYIQPDVINTLPRCDMRILAFGVGIPEWVWGKDLVDKYKIARLPVVAEFQRAVTTRHLQNVCLVSGNFHGSPTKKEQYVALGNAAMLGKCGFGFNP
jgi:hypothetical protein